MKERSRVCCNCRHNIRTGDLAHIENHCDNDGMRRERPCVVLKAHFLMTPEDAEKICAKLLEQSKDGLILLPDGVYYSGTVGANPEIRVLYDNNREDGYWEEDE